MATFLPLTMNVSKQPPSPGGSHRTWGVRGRGRVGWGPRGRRRLLGPAVGGSGGRQGRAWRPRACSMDACRGRPRAWRQSRGRALRCACALARLATGTRCATACRRAGAADCGARCARAHSCGALRTSTVFPSTTLALTTVTLPGLLLASQSAFGPGWASCAWAACAKRAPSAHATSSRRPSADLPRLPSMFASRRALLAPLSPGQQPSWAPATACCWSSIAMRRLRATQVEGETERTRDTPEETREGHWLKEGSEDAVYGVPSALELPWIW